MSLILTIGVSMVYFKRGVQRACFSKKNAVIVHFYRHHGELD